MAEAARLVVDEGHEALEALRRAAHQQGARLQHLRPSNESLQAAICEYRSLFRPQQVEQLRRQRALALQAMRSLADFRPRLFGALVTGDGPLDRIRLLLVADAAEAVILQLRDRHIPWRASEVTLQHAAGGRVPHPALSFVAGETEIELVILDHAHRSDPPRDPLTGGAMTTLGIAELEALVDPAPA